MPDDSNALPLGRLVRWIAIAVLLLLGLALYFRVGLQVAPLTAATPMTADPSR
jgi:hypothetical protein